MNRLVLTPLLIGLIMVLGCKNDEVKIQKSSLEGIIKDEFGGVLDSVECLIKGPSGEYKTMTGESGDFKFQNINVGKHILTISKKNYVTGSEEIDVKIVPSKIELTLTSGNSFLRTSDSLLTVTYSASAKDIIIESNTNWIIATDVTWLKSSIATGAGNNIVKIIWEKSNEDNPRVADIIFKAGTIHKRLRLIQSPPIKLLSSIGITGNYQNGTQDSIKLVFNKSIIVNSITSKDNFCISEIQSKVYGNILSFPFSCARLGNSYPFYFSVTDGFETLNFPLEIKFYNSKFTILGNVIDYFVTDDNNAIWAITHFPNKLLKFSLPDLTLLKELNLPFPPIGIKWNSFKNTINIFNQLYDCNYDKLVEGNCEHNYLMYLDPETLEITKSEIKLIKGYDADNFGYPYVFPKDISLFNNGTGLIQLANEDNNWGWRFIDSNNSDSTYISQYQYNYEDVKYQEIYINHDKSKMYMMHPSGSTTIDIYEMGNYVFKRHISPVPGYSDIIIPNKKSNRIYHAQLYEQFISDLDGYRSVVSHIDRRSFYQGTDFSYKAGEDETIYYLDEGYFRILDYKNDFTSFSTNTNQKLSDIRSTTDGINLAAIKRNGDGTTDLYVFNIDDITVNKISKSNSSGSIETTERNKIDLD